MSVQAVVDEQKEASAGLKRAELARLHEDPLPQNAEEHVTVLGYQAHVDRHRRQVAENDPKRRLAKALRKVCVAPLTTESVERYKEGVVRRSRIRANLESESILTMLYYSLATPGELRRIDDNLSEEPSDQMISCVSTFGIPSVLCAAMLGLLWLATGMGSWAALGCAIAAASFARYPLRLFPQVRALVRYIEKVDANPNMAKKWAIVSISEYNAFIPGRTLDIATALKKELGDDAELCVDYVVDDQTYQTVDRRALNALKDGIDDAMWAFDPFLVLNFNGDSIYVDFWDEKSYKPTYVEL